jgi:cation diffusion facilitator family transporter
MSKGGDARSSTGELLPYQREREHALALLLGLDYFAAFGLLMSGYLSGSLTLAADGLRAFLLLKIDVFALIVLRRIHRRRFGDYQFGTGKLERLVNVTVGLGMYAAGLWILFSALERLEAQPPPASALSVALGIAFADANLCLNVYGLFRVYRAHRAAPSIIMRTQYRSRLAMAISSSIVFAVVLASARVSDPTAGNLLDVLGSAFVCAVILWIGTSMVRESLPDLLDRSIDPRAQRFVLQTLAQHVDDYDEVIGLRSRRSGQEAFVEIELGFANHATLGEIARCSGSIVADLRRLLPDAHVRVIPVVSHWSGAVALPRHGSGRISAQPTAPREADPMPARTGSFRSDRTLRAVGTPG